MAEKRPLVIDSGTIKELQSGDTITASCTSATFTQIGHGFSVGDVVRFDSVSDWVKAQADTGANADVFGVVSVVAGNNFTVVSDGNIAGLSGLTAGAVYYLSASTAGVLTDTEPDPESYVSKPVLFAYSATAGIVQILRGLTQGTESFSFGLAIAMSQTGVFI